MRELEFRQKLKEDAAKRIGPYHYWGYIDDDFIPPLLEGEAVGDSEQYTGLKDANDVKIFEGDILGGRQAEPRGVIFENGSFRLYDDTSSGNQSIVPRSANRLKVIGNIYENPELLK